MNFNKVVAIKTISKNRKKLPKDCINKKTIINSILCVFSLKKVDRFRMVQIM